jgi:N-acyl-D-amino-acid deacylase
MYEPECYSTREELVQVLRPAAKRDLLLTCHIRGEGDNLAASVDEAISIARDAGMRLNISHFKATGRKNWRTAIFTAIDHIDAARSFGQDVTVDVYPYDAGASTLSSLFPPDTLTGGMRQAMDRLATAEGKRLVRESLAAPHPGWDNMASGIGWDRIIISSVAMMEHCEWQGRDFASLSAELGYDEPSDLMCELFASEQGKVSVIMRSMDMRDVRDVMCLPYAAVISDALYGGGSRPHPRLYGAFPRAIREFVGDGTLTFQAVINKMTGMPAERLRMTDRGVLREGAAADVSVFDPARFTDKATYLEPVQLAEGMDWVLVDGKPVWHNNSMMQ